MALLLVVSLVCTVGLLVALLILDRFVYRILRKLWQNRHRERLLSFVDEFPPVADDIIFLGDTHMADFRWEEHFPDLPIRNLGIPDETVAELAERLPQIVKGKPTRVILQTGGTDIRLGYRVGKTVADLDHILSTIRARAPKTDVLLMEVLPQTKGQAKRIKRLNQKLAERAADYNMPIVELFDELAGPQGALAARYSEDGYHLWGVGYERCMAEIRLDEMARW